MSASLHQDDMPDIPWTPEHGPPEALGVRPVRGVASPIMASMALLGLTPPQKRPLVTHLRGLAGRLVYGPAVADPMATSRKLRGRH